MTPDNVDYIALSEENETSEVSEVFPPEDFVYDFDERGFRETRSDTVRRATRILVDRLDPEAVYLIDQSAQGYFADGRIHVLVIVNDDADMFGTYEAIYGSLGQNSIGADAEVMRQSTFLDNVGTEGMFSYNAVRKGKLVYARTRTSNRGPLTRTEPLNRFPPSPQP